MDAKKGKKKLKPSYDFSKLSNSFSNSDLWEDTREKNTGPSQKNFNSFKTPYTDKAGHSNPLDSSATDTVSSLGSNNLNKTTIKVAAKKINPPRGKCCDWVTCGQCSISVDCGSCRHCLDKSLR